MRWRRARQWVPGCAQFAPWSGHLQGHWAGAAKQLIGQLLVRHDVRFPLGVHLLQVLAFPLSFPLPDVTPAKSRDTREPVTKNC